MIIKSCLDTPDEMAYQVFTEGYSDYSVKLEMPMAVFVSHFLEHEANRAYSFIAFEGERPVGIILGGIGEFQGIKTLRCGGFAVIPSHRRQGIGQILFDAHKAIAEDQGCKQLFLEVLKDNAQAIQFYENAGYTPIHDYRLYVHDKPEGNVLDLELEAIELDEILKIRKSMPELYINWQNELFDGNSFKHVVGKCIRLDGKIIGLILLKKSGGIQYIWVDSNHRHKGYGRTLLLKGLQEMGLEKSFGIASNNMTYEGFLKRMGFKNHLEQFEMMKLL